MTLLEEMRLECEKEDDLPCDVSKVIEEERKGKDSANPSHTR
jgi:hypothetical protein